MSPLEMASMACLHSEHMPDMHGSILTCQPLMKPMDPSAGQQAPLVFTARIPPNYRRCSKNACQWQVAVHCIATWHTTAMATRHTDGPCYEAPDSKAGSAHRGARRWRRPSFVCLPPEAEEVLERPASRMSLLGDPHMRLCFLVHAVGGRTLSGAAKHHACILDPPMHFPDLGACTSRSCSHALACHRHCDVGAGFSRVHHTISSGRGRT